MPTSVAAELGRSAKGKIDMNRRIYTALILLACSIGVTASVRGRDIDPQEELISKIERISKQDQEDGSYLDMALLASRLINPELDAKAIVQKLDGISKTAEQGWRNAKSNEEKVKALVKAVFATHGFKKAPGQAPMISGRGIYKTYSLPGVLEGKQGYCEGLSTIFMLVSEHVKLPVSIINLPVHTMCRVDIPGSDSIWVECLRQGDIKTEKDVYEGYNLRPAARNSGVYAAPLSKKQFLNLHVNALIYGLIQQEGGIAPFTMKQLTRLADVIVLLDPNRPESLETAALVHFKAGNLIRAQEIIKHAVEQAESLGGPSWVIRYFKKKQQEYQRH